MKTDVQLQRDVLDELEWEPSFDAAQIAVTSKEGVVTLTGHVESHVQMDTAERVAKRVYGVKAVANDIEVRPRESDRRDDADIATAAMHALQWNASVPDDQIQLTVRNGWLTLEGTVHWGYQKDAAYYAVRDLRGVHGVNNNVIVTPAAAPNEVKASIEAAYKRSATLRAKDIQVETEGSTVFLRGDVHSHREREEAERTAWAAPGVIRVENLLTITPWGYGPAEEWGY